jgi:hypothetical protein
MRDFLDFSVPPLELQRDGATTKTRSHHGSTEKTKTGKNLTTDEH